MTQPQDENARIRSYLIAQANRLALPELVAKVRADTAPLREAAALIAPERFTERPAEAEWSAAEVWTHILDMNEHGAGAITGILDRGEAPPRVTDAISGETRSGLQTGEEYYDVYRPRREELLERVLQATGDEHPDVKITHPMFGDLSWREWLLFMRVHDLDHLRQLQSIAAAFGQ
jgi:hypothetical protein